MLRQLTQEKAHSTLLVDTEFCLLKDRTTSLLEICVKRYGVSTPLLNTKVHYANFDVKNRGLKTNWTWYCVFYKI